MPTLSSLLVQRNVASMQAVEDAIARQVLYGDDLATNVLEVGAAREDDVTRLAAESIGMFPLPPGKIVLLEATVLRLLPGDVAQRYGIFPIEKRGTDLVVATSEPLSQNVEEDLGFLLNLNLRPVYALHVRIVQALSDHYGQPLERRYRRLLAKIEGRKSHDTEPPAPGGTSHDARLLRAAAAPTRAMEPPAHTTTITQDRAEPPPAAGSSGGVPHLLPQRPTLRGLPALKVAQDEPWGPSPNGAASTLPETIDLSPRPPAASTEATRAPSVPPPAEAARAPSVPPQAEAARAPSVPPRAPSVPPQAEEASEGVRTLPAPTFAAPIAEAPASPEGVPQALSSWARASATHESALEGGARRAALGGSPADARKPNIGAPRVPTRSRRKGPFPASLAEEEMQSAVNTDGILEVFFDFAQQYFEYAALFVVHGDIAEGRDASGRGADRARVTAVGLPLDLPSTLAAARDQRVTVLADFSAEGLDAELLQDLGRAPAGPGVAGSPTAPSHRAAAVVVPVVVRGRAVALLFGDDSPVAVELSSIGDVIAFAALAGASIERIILRRKLGRSGSSRFTPAAVGAVALRTEGLAPLRARAATPPAARPPEEAGAEPAPEAAKTPAAPAPRPAPPRGGLAALARMFGAPAVKAQRAPAAPGISLPPALVMTGESAPPDPFKSGALAEAVSETIGATHDSIPAAHVLVAPVEAALEAREPPRPIEPFEPVSSAQTPGNASIAFAFQTPSFDGVTSVVTPAPTGGSHDRWDADPGQLAPDERSDSSSDALTVALLVPAETPPPDDDIQAFPQSVEPDAIEPGAAGDNETLVVPDDAVETVVPTGVEPSATSSRACPSTSSRACPSTSSRARPSTSSRACPSTSSRACPSTSSRACPSTSSRACPSTSSRACPSTSSRACPSTRCPARPPTSTATPRPPRLLCALARRIARTRPTIVRTRQEIARALLGTAPA
jgi:hypothetical protein